MKPGLLALFPEYHKLAQFDDVSRHRLRLNSLGKRVEVVHVERTDLGGSFSTAAGRSELIFGTTTLFRAGIARRKVALSTCLEETVSVCVRGTWKRALEGLFSVFGFCAETWRLTPKGCDEETQEVGRTAQLGWSHHGVAMLSGVGIDLPVWV